MHFLQSGFVSILSQVEFNQAVQSHALLTPPLLEADLKLILFPWVSSSVVSNVVAVDFLECSATEY